MKYLKKVNIPKKTIANFSVKFGANVISRLLGFITLPIIAKALGPVFFGKWNLILLILGYIAIPLNFGFNVYGIREVAKPNSDTQLIVNKIISSRVLLSIISISIGTIIICVIYFHDLVMLKGIFIGYLLILAQAINIEFYYIGKKNITLPSISQIFGQFIFVLGTYFFIRGKDDLIILSLFYACYNLATSILMIWFYYRTEIIKIKLSINDTIDEIKKTFRLGLAGLIEGFASGMPILFISVFLGSYCLGIFSATFKIISVIILAFQTIQTVIAPHIVNLRYLEIEKLKAHLNKLLILMVLIGLFTSMICYFLNNFIFNLLFGIEYYESIQYFNLLLLLYIPIMPLAMFLGSFLIYFEEDKLYFLTTIFTSLSVFVFSPILVHKFSIYGGVIAMIISMFIYTCSGAIYVRQIVKKMHLRKI